MEKNLHGHQINKDSLRLVFIGTPDFAVPSLAAILEAGYRVVGVITAPDRHAGRGMKLQPSPIKEFAEQNHLKVLQPTNLKNEDFVAELRELKAHIQVVIAFRMLPEAVWNMPEMGTINLHASLLPDYRGAAPINWAIMNGEIETGLTTFRLLHEIDTGDILSQVKVAIEPSDNVGRLHDKLMHVGAELIVDTIEGVRTNTIIGKAQKVLAHHKKAPKIFKEDCVVDWSQTGRAIVNKIRGLAPYPVARCIFNNKQLKVYSAHCEQTDENGNAGQCDVNNQYLRFACTDGYVYLDDVQLEGKKRMDVIDFLRGLN